MIAPFSQPDLTQGVMARAVSLAAAAPSADDRPRAAQPLHAASHVALAPAAMTALIEAQERLAQNASRPVRQDTAQKLDLLISRLNDTPTPVATHADVPFAIRRLLVARQAISQSLVDLQA